MAPSGIGDSIEGHHAVAAAVEAGRVIEILVETSRTDGYAELLGRAEAAGVSVMVVDDVGERAATTTPQGIVARCRRIPTVSLAAAVAATEPAALLVLDHVEDPRNVGAIARSAQAAGIGALVLSTRRAAPPGATAFKAAAGALESLRVALVSSIPAALDELRREDLWLVGLQGDAEQRLFGLELLTEPVAIVVGAEGKGLSRLVGERCDQLVSIPMAAGVESLNVSVAASLAAFELARVRA
jgi:23S rRNA (guanosine2251-2'-O)-methyltransferase